MNSAHRGRSRNVTLKDVALLAEVSIATASKALNGKDDVHPGTRARVISAAERLSFTPSLLARGLLAGRTGTVGLLTSDLEGRFSMPILMGAEDAFGSGKMSVMLCDARGDAIREAAHLRTLLARRVDGLLVVGDDTLPRASLGRDLPVPVVYVYAPSDDPDDISVVPDNVDAARLVTRHLLQTGRTRIAHITGDRRSLAARERADTVVELLTESGHRLVEEEALFGEWSESWGRTATAGLLDRHPQIDALLCGSDEIARGALDVLRERHIPVPQQVAVAGFDNWEVLAMGSRPQLTSVDMDLEHLGRVAAQRLVAALDGQPAAGTEHLPCRLVVRGSTVPEA